MASNNTDNIIDQLLAGESNNESDCLDVSEAIPSDQRYKRERLVALAAGAQTEVYLGKTYSIDQIEALQESTIVKLCSRYEARLGAIMTKTLGKSTLELAAIIASNFLPIPPKNRPKLVQELSEDPFVDHALNGLMCQVFHQYGALLAPITAAILTAEHCNFRHGYQPSIPQQDGFGGGEFTASGVTDASSGDTSVTDNNESNEKKS